MRWPSPPNASTSAGSTAAAAPSSAAASAAVGFFVRRVMDAMPAQREVEPQNIVFNVAERRAAASASRSSAIFCAACTSCRRASGTTRRGPEPIYRRAKREALRRPLGRRIVRALRGQRGELPPSRCSSFALGPWDGSTSVSQKWCRLIDSCSRRAPRRRFRRGPTRGRRATAGGCRRRNARRSAGPRRVHRAVFRIGEHLAEALERLQHIPLSRMNELVDRGSRFGEPGRRAAGRRCSRSARDEPFHFGSSRISSAQAPSSERDSPPPSDFTSARAEGQSFCSARSPAMRWPAGPLRAPGP